MRKFYLSAIIAALTLLFSSTVLKAQDMCEASVLNAFAQANLACSLIGGETACIGSGFAQATTVTGGIESYIQGNIIDLTTVSSIQTSAYDPLSEEWGIAYLRTNPEGSLGSVVLLMMGDVRIDSAGATTTEATLNTQEVGDPIAVMTEADTSLLDNPATEATSLASITAFSLIDADAISADGAFLSVTFEGMQGWVALEDLVFDPAIESLPAQGNISAPPSVDPIAVMTEADTSLLDSPATGATLLASITAFSLIDADAISADGAFLSVTFEGMQGWVALDDLVFDPAIESLPSTVDSAPVVEAESVRSLSQIMTIQLATGSASPCEQASNRVLIQAPLATPVDFNVNSASIRTNGTISIGNDIIDNQNVFFVYAIDGETTLLPDTINEVIIPAGSLSYSIMQDDETVSALFSLPVAVAGDGEGLLDLANFSAEILIPPTLLNTPLVISGLEEDSRCVLTPVAGIGQIEGRVGPGTGRTVRMFLPLDETYEAAETVEEDGLVYYGIDTESFGRVYSDADAFTEDCATTIREVRTECILEPLPDAGQIGGYTGPATNRSIVLYFGQDDIFVPISSIVDEVGNLWFEVPYETAGLQALWVLGDNYQNIEGCENLANSGE